MTGRFSGCVTRFQNAAKPGFIRVWCGAHQLNIVLQDVYVHFGDDEFHGVLVSIISYIRRQQNLISEIKTACPKIATSRWESMSKVGSWFKARRVRVRAYFAEKNPVCTPSDRWWIYIMITEAFAARATVTFKQIQGHSVTVSIQREHLKSFDVFLHLMRRRQRSTPGRWW